MTKLEMETIITFNHEEDTAELYTASPTIYRRMTKRGFIAEKVDSESWVFKFPRQCVRLPQKPARISSEKRLSLVAKGKALADRFKGGKRAL